jgi:hypothetical protein
LPPTDQGPDGSLCYLIWPENWPAFLLFQVLERQWRINSNGTRVGWDVSALRAHLEFTVDDRDTQRALYADLMLMERPAVLEFEAAEREAFEKARREAEKQTK